MKRRLRACRRIEREKVKNENKMTDGNSSCEEKQTFSISLLSPPKFVNQTKPQPVEWVDRICVASGITYVFEEKVRQKKVGLRRKWVDLDPTFFLTQPWTWRNEIVQFDWNCYLLWHMANGFSPEICPTCPRVLLLRTGRGHMTKV